MFLRNSVIVAPLILKKVFNRRFYRADAKRHDKPKANQVSAFFRAPTRVYSIDDTNFYLGSAYNVAQTDGFDFHVNCAASEVTIKSRAVSYEEIHLHDTNDILICKDELDCLAERIIHVLTTSLLSDDHLKRVLFTCFMGASRSVGVLIYILDCIQRYHNALNFNKLERIEFMHSTDAEIRFDNLYSAIKQQRPCVSISSSLRALIIGCMRENDDIEKAHIYS